MLNTKDKSMNVNTGVHSAVPAAEMKNVSDFLGSRLSSL